MNQLVATPSVPALSASWADATPRRFAFVHAMWHADIVCRGRDAFLAEMARHHIPPEQIDVIEKAKPRGGQSTCMRLRQAIMAGAGTKRSVCKGAAGISRPAREWPD